MSRESTVVSVEYGLCSQRNTATKKVVNTLPCNMALWQSNKFLYLVQIVIFSDIVSTNLFTGKENRNVYLE